MVSFSFRVDVDLAMLKGDRIKTRRQGGWCGPEEPTTGRRRQHGPLEAGAAIASMSKWGNRHERKQATDDTGNHRPVNTTSAGDAA
jgi:hypothetical protein